MTDKEIVRLAAYGYADWLYAEKKIDAPMTANERDELALDIWADTDARRATLDSFWSAGQSTTLGGR